MKKILLFLSLVFSFLSMQAQEDATVLLISKLDKTSVGYLLKEKPTVIFNGQTFDVKYNNIVDRYSFSDVVSVSYVSEDDISSTGIVLENNQIASFNIKNNNIVISSPNQSLIRIYNTSGELLYTKSTKANSLETIELKQFKTGVYILSIDSLTFKFTI